MMALRHVLGEWVLEGTLVTESALAIGSGDPGAVADMGCLRDGAGRLCIPGSALAGALSGPEARGEWGSIERASLLYVEDALLKPGAPEQVEVRDGVGLDRRTGAAATGVLYARETVAKGSAFELQLRVEAVAGVLSAVDAQRWLNDIAAELARGCRLGAATSSGLGLVKLTKATMQWRGIGDRAGLLALLTGQTPRTALASTAASQAAHLLRITVPWQQRSPILVSVATNGLVDKIPLTTGTEQVRLVLPGSSIKGALRSRAERIVRTLTGSPLPDGDFVEQMAQNLGPVGRLFGLPLVKDGETVVEGRRGAIVVHECYSDVVPDWKRIQATLAYSSTGQAPAQRNKDRKKQRAAATQLLKTSDLRITDHVAISRWTGGADPGKLFATVAPGHWYRWPALQFTVDLRRLGDATETRSALMLLLYVLRDLAEGWIPLGYVGTRGYGEVVVDPQKPITLEAAPDAAHGLHALNDKTLADLFGDQSDQHQLLTAWLAELDSLKTAQARQEVTVHG